MIVGHRCKMWSYWSYRSTYLVYRCSTNMYQESFNSWTGIGIDIVMHIHITWGLHRLFWTQFHVIDVCVIQFDINNIWCWNWNNAGKIDWSIFSMLMSWLLALPGNKQPWCWQCRINGKELIFQLSLPSQFWNQINSLDRVTHISFSKLTIIGSGNGLSPDRHQVILWIKAGILLMWSFGTDFSEPPNRNSYIFILEDALENVVWKWQSFCVGLNMLKYISRNTFNAARVKSRGDFIGLFLVAYWQFTV